MKVFIIFFVSFGISFAGSLQAGLVNISVIKTTITKNLRSAIWLAAGGSIPEIIYSALAILTGNMVLKNNQVFLILKYGMIPVFLILGLYTIFNKPSQKNNTEKERKSRSEFWKGFSLAIINPQLLPFWFGVYIYANSSIFPINKIDLQISFILGTGFGAFLILCVLAFLAKKNKERIENWLGNYNFNKLTGFIFIGLAVWQLLKLTF